MLDFVIRENSWTPSEVSEKEIYGKWQAVRKNLENCQVFLFIFQTRPYIDSVLIDVNNEVSPVINRFTFHEDYCWDKTQEELFVDLCLNNPYCQLNTGAIDEIYKYYGNLYPQWHLKRYHTRSFKVLDHVYHCLKQNTVKEMLYKAGLDELAVNLECLDEINVLAVKPSEIYSGISMRILKNLNCEDGAKLLSCESKRKMIKDINSVFPDTFKTPLNGAQCRYIDRLIEGQLTAGEIGRLFASRRNELFMFWNKSQFELFLLKERQEREVKAVAKQLSDIDPIYKNYLEKMEDNKEYRRAHGTVNSLAYYLLYNRVEFDKKIRRSNRKRIDEWQERGDKYFVRYPQTINDFCREAVYMQNCLLTYVEALINNDTTILFVRKTDDVNKPFITMEIYNNTLMQAYHRFNRDCTEEEAGWIREYCDRHGIQRGRFVFNANVDQLF